MNRLSLVLSMMFTGLILIFSACKKSKNNPVENPPVQNEGELITTLVLRFEDTLGIEPIKEFEFRDLDGVGGANPSKYDTIRLMVNSTYKVGVFVYNEAASPSIDLTNEIKSEGKDHLFCFDYNSTILEILKTDSDGSYPIGLESLWTSKQTNIDQVKVSLKHQPGIKNGDCGIGETDLELTFRIEIQ